MRIVAKHRSVAAPICGVLLVALSACGSTNDRQASADADPAGVGTSAEASRSGESMMAASAPAPAIPRTSWQSAGHVVTMMLRPGPGSGPVSSYEFRVAPLNALPDAGRQIESCAANPEGSTACGLAPLKRGDWDIWVRAVGADVNQRSDWYRGAWAKVYSCTNADALAGTCEKFDTGPGGGFVFYDAGSRQPWGQYLEGAPGGWAESIGGRTSFPWCPGKDSSFSTNLGTSTAIGTGATNTKTIIAACGSDSAAGAAQAYAGGGLRDWVLPSSGELNEMFNYRSELSMYGRRYWSSSQVASFPSTAVQEVFAQYTLSKGSVLPGETIHYPLGDEAPVRPIRAF